jgi:hypothetical protein
MINNSIINKAICAVSIDNPIPTLIGLKNLAIKEKIGVNNEVKKMYVFLYFSSNLSLYGVSFEYKNKPTINISKTNFNIISQ